jgi:hypothetical protein
VRSMKRPFFDLTGEILAHDILGHQCRSPNEAKDHGQFIVNRIGLSGQLTRSQGTISPSETRGRPDI